MLWAINFQFAFLITQISSLVFKHMNSKNVNIQGNLFSESKILVNDHFQMSLTSALHLISNQQRQKSWVPLDIEMQWWNGGFDVVWTLGFKSYDAEIDGIYCNCCLKLKFGSFGFVLFSDHLKMIVIQNTSSVWTRHGKSLS